MKPGDERVEGVASRAVDAAFQVHRALGPGLLESAYEACLAHELAMRRIPVLRQQFLPVEYKGERVEAGYRVDLLVDEALIIEVKSVDCLAPIHTAQVLTYLRLSGLRLGFLINFNSVRFKDGIKRIVL
jgi:GxxExxY protein